ncbi:MAG: alpha-amylase family glycosyl hydrolase [Bacteroidia bacterium]|nr:alpha-amylase family glycosyl hydrolase [Bacteroidia bacterium]
MKKLFLLLVASTMLFSCGNKKQTDNQPVTGIHPEWVYGATIYEVNTRQFTPEGTFNAFVTHLPRLKELGVDILWFMPIQTIGEKERKGTLGSYYSIQNYTEVNSEFGSMDDFKNVVKQAHNLGLKVILDWVPNHTSRDHEWITEHPDWYRRDSLGNPIVMYDWTDIAPLDYEKTEMRSAMLNAMMFWIRETDIDGFRCDVAYEVPTDFWETAKDSLIALKSDIFMLAEAEKPELNESIFNAFYAWDFHHKMNMVAQGKEPVDSLRLSLKRLNNRFSPNAIPLFFTSNHDENSWNGTEFERMGDAAKTFAVLTYMLPGIPLIYNGQEAGLNRRLAFFEKDSIDWTDKANFAELYKSLNALKKANKALLSQERSGEITEIVNDKPANVFSFKRENEGSEIVCVFNLSKNSVKVVFGEEVPGTSFSAFPNAEAAIPVKEMELKPWEYKVFYKE